MEKLKGINSLSLGRHSLLCLASWCEVSVGKPCIISAGIFGLSSAEVSLPSAGKASRSQGEGLFFFSCPSAFCLSLLPLWEHQWSSEQPSINALDKPGRTEHNMGWNVLMLSTTSVRLQTVLPAAKHIPLNPVIWALEMHSLSPASLLEEAEIWENELTDRSCQVQSLGWTLVCGFKDYNFAQPFLFLWWAMLLIREPDRLDCLAFWNVLKLVFLSGLLSLFKNNQLQIGVSPLVSVKYYFFVYETGSHLHLRSAWNSIHSLG